MSNSSHGADDHARILAAAHDDHESVIDLTRALVRIPSRGGIDDYQPIVALLAGWLGEHELPACVQRDTAGAPVGVTVEVRGGHSGPRWVLDACVDTAPFGDENAWTHNPTSGVVENGWLCGRGGADSKVAVAIFCHLAARLAAAADELHGSLTLLFDLDEHTGGFGGAKRYFEGLDAPSDVAGVMIGYPGLNKIVVGGRGIYRGRVHVYGTSSHSGGSNPTPNAIVKAAELVRMLSAPAVRDGSSPDFPLPGKVTVTAIAGGQGYSVTPDLCTVNVDIRTTPDFDDVVAATLLDGAVTVVDQAWPHTAPTLIEVTARWPAFALPADSPPRAALFEAAVAFGVAVEPKIDATDERFAVDSVPIVQAVYHAALHRLLRH